MAFKTPAEVLTTNKLTCGYLMGRFILYNIMEASKLSGGLEKSIKKICSSKLILIKSYTD